MKAKGLFTAAVLFLFLLGGAEVSLGALSWKTMSSGTTTRLTGIWGSASSDVFAVGSGGTILHYNGTVWSAMASGTTHDLNDIWGSASNDVFAVGSNDTILHYNGTAWSPVTTGMTGNNYSAIWGSASNDIFVVEFDAIYRFNGSTWTLMPNTSGARSDIWGSSSSNVFAVGGYDAGSHEGYYLLHYDGAAWTRAEDTGMMLWGIWGSSPYDVFTVGDNAAVPGSILHYFSFPPYNAANWTSMSTGGGGYQKFFGVWGTAANDVFAVGITGAILHYDATAWSPMTSGVSEDLEEIWGSSATDIFAVGSNGTILHYGPGPGVTTGNLVQNPGFETGNLQSWAISGGGDVYASPAYRRSGGYGAWIMNGPIHLKQDIDVSTKAVSIDAGTASVAMGGYVGGFNIGGFEYSFLDAANTQIGSGFQTGDGGDGLAWEICNYYGSVPPLTRTIRMEFVAGSSPMIDVYFDDAFLYLTTSQAISLPSPWVGSVSITSDKNVVAVGRPHIGSEVASYDGFTAGALNAYIPMLFKNAFGGSYSAAFYVQNVHAANTANLVIKYYDSAGSLSCTVNDTVAPFAAKGYWIPGQSCLPAGWVGGVVVASDQPIVAIGRPHIGTEVMSYDSFSSGSLTSYLPMLFKDAFGGSYDSAFYVQNVHAANTASLTIKFYDNAGALRCTKSDTVAPLASQGYWLPGESCLPTGWVGGAVVTSDQPIVTVGRPHIGDQITTYNGFSAGAASSYVPMLFKGAFGGSYDAAFYVQNVHGTTTANLAINYYNSAGTLSCTVNDTVAPLASKGYWVPGQSCLPAGWVGGVVVTSDQPVVAVGRPHIGDQVTTYNGFASGSLSSYLPMLFKDAFGGSYNSAFYMQNTEASAAAVTIKFYDSTGALTCTRSDTIPALSTLGLWLPSLTCIQ